VVQGPCCRNLSHTEALPLNDDTITQPLVMELVEGPTLADRLETEPRLDVGTAIHQAETARPGDTSRPRAALPAGGRARTTGADRSNALGTRRQRVEGTFRGIVSQGSRMRVPHAGSRGSRNAVGTDTVMGSHPTGARYCPSRSAWEARVCPWQRRSRHYPYRNRCANRAS
jgi:hypothetical protein